MKAPIDRRKALSAALLAACGGGDTPPSPPSVAASPPRPPPAQPPPPQAPPPPPLVSSGVAVKWSNLATDAMLADTTAQPPGLSPMEQSRILAMAFLAGHDALNNIGRVYQPYAHDGRYGDVNPAVNYEIAVCKVLMALLPSHALEFDRVLQLSLADNNVCPHGSDVELGEACAQQMLALRADDGVANAQGPHVPGLQSVDYQPTPPVKTATFVNWGKVRPFVMSSGNQFRAPPP